MSLLALPFRPSKMVRHNSCQVPNFFLQAIPLGRLSRSLIVLFVVSIVVSFCPRSVGTSVD